MTFSVSSAAPILIHGGLPVLMIAADRRGRCWPTIYRPARRPGANLESRPESAKRRGLARSMAAREV